MPEPVDFEAHLKRQLEDQAAQFVPVKSQFANTFLDESNNTPLDVTVTDEMINGYVRTRSTKELERLPAGITNPQVVFTPEAVVLMAKADIRNIDTVISVHAVPSATGDGQLRLRILRMKAGRLPMPEALLSLLAEHAESRVQALERKLEAAQKGDKGHRRATRVELDMMKAVRQLLRGEEAVIDTRKHRLYLESAEMMPGRLRAVGRRVDKTATGEPAAPSGAPPQANFLNRHRSMPS